MTGRRIERGLFPAQHSGAEFYMRLLRAEHVMSIIAAVVDELASCAS